METVQREDSKLSFVKHVAKTCCVGSCPLKLTVLTVSKKVLPCIIEAWHTDMMCGVDME